MHTISAELQAHLEQESTTLATCWKLKKPDGTIMGFTDHDVDIVYNGITYSANGAYTPSAVDQSSDLAVDNMELGVLLSANFITEADLIAGEYDYSEVWIFVINYEDTTMGTLPLQRGNIGEVEIVDGEFTVELRSLTQRLQQVVGRSYLAACDVELGSTKCGIDLTLASDWVQDTAYAVDDVVSSVNFDGRQYTCTVAGVSGSTEPTWDTTVGNTTTDETDDPNWVTSTAYVLDDYVSATVYDNNRYKCTYAGTSGASEPTWDTTLGNTTRDIVDTDWAASTTYAVNDYVAATTFDNRRYKCTTAGDSGAVEPTWDTTISNTTSDPATTTWAATTDYSVNDYVEPTTPNGYVYQCTTDAGSSAASEPATWPTTPGNTVVDGGVTWTCRVSGAVWVCEDGPALWLAEQGTVTWVCSDKAFYYGGTVTTATSNKKFIDTSRSEANLYFSGGLLTWESGNNAGRSMEVRAYLSATKEFELFESMPENIQVGDSYRVYAGCDKDFATCKTKFSNGDNFRGFPHIPGRDEAMQYGRH